MLSCVLTNFDCTLRFFIKKNKRRPNTKSKKRKDTLNSPSKDLQTAFVWSGLVANNNFLFASGFNWFPLPRLIRSLLLYCFFNIILKNLILLKMDEHEIWQQGRTKRGRRLLYINIVYV
jgi:hypothetical protein